MTKISVEISLFFITKVYYFPGLAYPAMEGVAVFMRLICFFFLTACLTVGLLRRGREARRHRASPEGRDRGAHRRGPPPAARSSRGFLFLEQQ